ncbi:hypothetical protein PVC01_020007000 [Plasmodium vivax]|uniref:Uncharacterized protein n=1 Tax=Plasmodium vivax TaxID=5855 RepID=A0A1G4H6Q4_PLAVI|nr:hypothetical protein PVC01_020007000 [Plasmodium vivax]
MQMGETRTRGNARKGNYLSSSMKCSSHEHVRGVDTSLKSSTAKKQNRAEVNRAEVNRAEVNRAEVNRAEVNRAEVNRAEVNRAEVNRAEVNRAEVNRAEVNRFEVAQNRSSPELLKTNEVLTLALRFLLGMQKKYSAEKF